MTMFFLGGGALGYEWHNGSIQEMEAGGDLDTPQGRSASFWMSAYGAPVPLITESQSRRSIESWKSP